MSELDLLREALTNENEAERDGIKYVFMDADTVYRFANNRMKKVSKSLINKALKTKPEKQSENEKRSFEQSENENEQHETKSKKKKINKKQLIIEEEEENEEPEFEPEPKRKIKKMNKTSNKPPQSLPFELSEYYENKYKLEHMTQEMEHLNQKITKLKHYKHLINKLTGGEIEDLPNTTTQQTQPQDNTTNKAINYDIFDF